MKRVFATLLLGAATALLPRMSMAEEIKIGFQIAMTGPLASVGGRPLRNGIELALKKIEEAQTLGAGRSLLPIITDNASDKTQAITLTSQLCMGDNVAIMIGPFGSAASAAAAPVANELECPSIMIAVSPEVTKAGSWIFKAYENPSAIMRGLADYIVTLKPKNVLVVYNNDNPAVIDYKNSLVEFLRAAGISDLPEETILSAQTDFAALATKIVDRDPDVLFIGTPPEGSANLIIQARQAGLSEKVKVVGSDYFTSPAFLKVGGGAVEGVVYPTHYSAARSDAFNKAFVDSYLAAYGSLPDSYAAVAYNATWAAALAIKDAGPSPTRDQIRQALLRIKDVDSIMGAGKMSIDGERSVRYDMLMATVSDGKQTIVAKTAN